MKKIDMFCSSRFGTSILSSAVLVILPMTEKAQGQTFTDEFDWLPATPSSGAPVAMGSITYTNPNGHYSIMQAGTSVHITNYVDGSGDRHDNLRWIKDATHPGNSALTFTFSRDITTFGIQVFNFSTNEEITFDVAATHIEPPAGQTANFSLSSDKRSATSTSSSNIEWIRWSTLPNGTNSITLDTNFRFNGDIGVTAVSYTLDPVPEPSSAALLGLGMLGFLVRRKR